MPLRKNYGHLLKFLVMCRCYSIVSKISGLLFILMFCSTLMWGQQKDLLLWNGVELEKEFVDKFELGFTQQVRMKNNINNFKSLLFNLSGTYKIHDLFRWKTGYRFTIKPTENAHRFYNDFTFKYGLDAAQMDWSLRMRVQHDFSQYDPTNHRIRPRIMWRYKPEQSRFSPYFLSEVFYTINNTKKEFDNMRFGIGTALKLSKRNRLSLGYLFDKEFNVSNPENNHILTVGFEITLDKVKKKKKE